MNKGIVFMVGAAVGAAAALLLSPNDGEKNREILAEKIDRYSSNGGELFRRATDTVRDKVRDTGGNVRPAADEIRAKIEEARARIAEQVARNRGVQDVEADVADVAEDIADGISGAAPAQA